MPTPAGVPVAIRSPGCRGMPADKVSMVGGNVKKKKAGIRALPQLAVDVAGDRRVGDIDLLTGYRDRAHRAERVLRLADQPLTVASLQVARRHIIDDGIAPDVIECVLGADATTALADNNRELRLVIDRRRHLRIDDDGTATRPDGLGHFGENDWTGGHRAPASPSVKAAAGKFVGVIVVILADAKDVPPR